jgi:2-haloacid dehalogenase
MTPIDRGYQTVLFDLDHTLLDSDTSMSLAYEHTMRAFGVAEPWAHHGVFERINASLWAAVERQEIGPEVVRTRRFERLAAELDLDADAQAMGDRFVSELGARGELYPGVREVLDALRPRATMALVTNGIGEVQRTRIARLGLEPYLDAVVISGEVGTAKPGSAIFDLVFDLLGGPDRATTVMVGDSLSSDMRGGRDYGIATAWYNPDGRSPVDDGSVTHVLHHLTDLLDLVAPLQEVV